MARIRTIKPDFFRHKKLHKAEVETGLPLRLAFAGLWTAADREGRFRWEPDELKLDCLPYDAVDFSRVLDALVTRGFLVRYARDDREYGAIPSWKDHQHVNPRETASKIPQPTEDEIKSTRTPRVTDACPTRHDLAHGEGKGKERKEDAPSAPFELVTSKVPSEQADLYDRGKKVLGKNAGGLIAKLLRSKNGSVPEARAAIEMASTKQDAREYIGRIIAGQKPEFVRHSYHDPNAGIL